MDARHFVAALFLAAAAPVVAQVTGQDVLEGLAIPERDVAVLEEGGILAYSDKQYESTNRELAADAIVLVDQDLSAVHDALEGATTLIPAKVILDDGDIHNESDFGDVAYGEEDYDEVVRLFKAEPGKDFNFSNEEFALINQRLRPLRRATRAEQTVAASAIMREILIRRYRSYLAQGLDGVSAYQRSRRKAVNIGDELRLTTETFEPFADDFPAFYKAMSEFPDAGDCCNHYFRWLKVDIRDRPTFALSHTIIEEQDDYVLYTERHYFVNNTLNSVQITLGWVPYDEGTYMGLAMSASADILDSMMGKMLRPLGRNKAKDLVTDVMTEVRDILDDPAGE